MGFADIFNSLVSSFATKKKVDIWDTALSKEYAYLDDGEELSDERQEELEEILSTPCALLFAFDRNLEAYLYRLSLWGKLSFRYVDPDRGIDKGFTDIYEFYRLMKDASRKKQFGLWEAEEEKVNKIRFYRKFQNLKGRQSVEEIFINIQLRPDLAASLRRVRRDKGLS